LRMGAIISIVILILVTVIFWLPVPIVVGDIPILGYVAFCISKGAPEMFKFIIALINAVFAVLAVLTLYFSQKISSFEEHAEYGEYYPRYSHTFYE